MTYELQRKLRVTGEAGKVWRSMRQSDGTVYQFTTEQEAKDAIKLWDSGGSLRSDFRIVETRGA